MRLMLILGLLSLLGVGCASGPKVMRVRVMSYNIHHGRGMDSKFDYERIAKFVKKYNPDVVGFQEVDNKTNRSSGIDQMAEIGKFASMTGHFGKAMAYDGGEYGEGVLTKLKTLGVTNYALKCTPGNEPRAALAIKVDGGPGPLTFIGTHLCHQSSDDRTWQAKQINEHLKGRKDLMVMVGDFNSKTSTEAYHTLRAEWDDMMLIGGAVEPTIPSDNPRSRIDFIFARPKGKWRVVEAKVLEDNIASDHRGIFAILECDILPEK